MIFGVLNPEKISHENLTGLSTSPVRCSYFTLGNPKKVIFNGIIHRYFWLFVLYLTKTNCNPPAHPTWKCYHTSLRIAKLFHPTEGLLRSFKRRRLWRARCGLSSVALKGTGCGVWQLECQASNVTVSVQHLLTHASSFFRHWSVA